MFWRKACRPMTLIRRTPSRAEATMARMRWRSFIGISVLWRKACCADIRWIAVARRCPRQADVCQAPCGSLTPEYSPGMREPDAPKWRWIAGQLNVLSQRLDGCRAAPGAGDQARE